MATKSGVSEGVAQGSVEDWRASLGPDADRIWQQLQVMIYQIDGVQGSPVNMELPEGEDVKRALVTLLEYVRQGEIDVVFNCGSGELAEKIKEKLREYAAKKGLKEVDLSVARMLLSESVNDCEACDYGFIRDLFYLTCGAVDDGWGKRFASNSSLDKSELVSLVEESHPYARCMRVAYMVAGRVADGGGGIVISNFNKGAVIAGLDINDEFLESLTRMLAGNDFFPDKIASVCMKGEDLVVDFALNGDVDAENKV